MIVGLLVITCVVFGPVFRHEFINYDDDIYLTNNTHINRGISIEALRWAATSVEAANWHPLTWLSHLLDVEFFGLAPAGHHLVNVVFHLLNVILLFLLLERLTGSLAKSGFVAALFAVHPQHVESVAWIAERKDVLSAFFWMLTLGAYLRHVQAGRKQVGRRRNCFLLLVLFLLGLMSKPMVITLPFTLLLLDYWPLNRTAFGRHAKQAAAQKREVMSLRALLLEKAPLFVLAGLSLAVSYFAQLKGGAVSSLQSLPISLRITNALVAYARYLGKTFWPVDLAILYPLPEAMLPAWQIVGAVVLLIVITGAALTKAGKHPHVSVGWFWFLGTLVPVIGLLQVGTQHVADRYTYLPSIGIFVAVTWAIPVATKHWRGGAGIRSGAALVIVACLMGMSARQVGHWRDSVTVFSHVIDVIGNNWMAHDHLGAALAARGEHREAIAHYLEAITIKPEKADAIKPRLVQSYSAHGDRLLQEGRLEEAVANYRQALSLSRTIPQAHNKLAVALARQGRDREATESFLEALELNPGFVEAHFNLGFILERQGRGKDAIPHYEAARRLSPGDAEIAGYLRRALENEARR